MALFFLLLSGLGASCSREAENASPAASMPAVEGVRLVEDLACLSCHSTDGRRGTGPTWNDLEGSQVTLSDGRTIVADREYLLRSILDPSAETVAGYPKDLMAQTVRAGTITREQAEAILRYIETL